MIYGLRALADEVANRDVEAIAGHPGWSRLPAGDWRVLYFSDTPDIVVERIVTRRDLERTLGTLS